MTQARNFPLWIGAAIVVAIVALLMPPVAQATHDGGSVCRLYAISRDGRRAVVYDDFGVNGGAGAPRLVDLDTGTQEPLQLAVTSEDGSPLPLPAELAGKYGLSAPPPPRACSPDGRYCVAVGVTKVSARETGEAGAGAGGEDEAAGTRRAPTYRAALSVRLVGKPGTIEIASLDWSAYSRSEPQFTLESYWVGDRVVVVGGVQGESQPEWGATEPVLIHRKLPPAPTYLPLPVTIDAAVRRALRLRPEDRSVLIEPMRVLGWSRSGAFAYVVEPPDEACGCWFANVEVVSLATDETLFEEKYSSEGVDGGPQSFDAWWAKEGQRLSTKLAELGIEPIQNARLERLPAGGVRAELRVTRTALEQAGGGTSSSPPLSSTSGRHAAESRSGAGAGRWTAPARST